MSVLATRRRALAAAAGAVLPLALGVRAARAQADGDAAVLAGLVELEQVSVFSYEAAAAGGLLGAQLSESARLFRDYQQQHLDALSTELEALGGARPAPPLTIRDADAAARDAGVERSLAAARTREDVLRFALELELASVAAYRDAISRLQDAKLLQTALSIMASEGQQLVVLRGALGEEPVPRALETGR